MRLRKYTDYTPGVWDKQLRNGKAPRLLYKRPQWARDRIEAKSEVPKGSTTTTGPNDMIYRSNEREK